ncbi:MAG: glycosyltransferase family 2 protein [Methylobacter sp.]
MTSKQISSLLVVGGFVYGWAFDSLRPSLKVSLSIDGSVLADGLTGYSVIDEFYSFAVPPTTDCGFVLPLPVQALDGFSHQLTVKIIDWRPISDALQASVRWCHGDNCGEVDLNGQGFIEGWVGFRDLTENDNLPNVDVVDDNGQTRSIKLASAHSFNRSEFRSAGYFKVSQAQLCDLVKPVYQCRGVPLRQQSGEASFKPVGQLEAVDYQGIRGWALNASNFLETLDLVLVIDGLPLKSIRPNIRRYDIAAHLGLLPEEVGIAGFHIALPVTVKDGVTHTFSIQCRNDGSFLEPKSLNYIHPQRGRSLSQVLTRLGRATLPSCYNAVERSQTTPVVSVVILNRNGADCLEALFQSWSQHNSMSVEIIVIDHGSSDGSLLVLNQWESRLPLHIVALDTNDSFSASCNRGAKLARGKFVLFLNNDIVWQHDALPVLVQTMQDTKVGVVGLKLLKTESAKDKNMVLSNVEVQHLGVRFTLVDGQYWPYEATLEQGMPETQFGPQEVPAVTGAVMLCRRDEFLELGGFDENYFYGYEDVEFCLRLHQRTGRRIISRNDLVALHRHGYTRLTGREPAVFDKQQSNQTQLARQLGLWVKRAWWQSLINGDKQLTNEVLTIGFVIHDSGVSDDQLIQSVKLAESLLSLYPDIECVFLSQEKNWNDTGRLHALISFTPLFDLRNLKHLRGDLRTACFIDDEQLLYQWSKSPCLDHFDTYLCGNEGLASKFTKLMPSSLVPNISSSEVPLGSLLDSKLLRVLLRVPDSSLNAAAKKIRAGFKQHGVLVAQVDADQWRNLSKVADVIITLYGQSEKLLPHFDRREGAVNIVWLLDASESIKISGLTLVDELWFADEHLPEYFDHVAATRRKVEIKEKQLKRITGILQQIVEEHVGRSFCAS